MIDRDRAEAEKLDRVLTELVASYTDDAPRAPAINEVLAAKASRDRRPRDSRSHSVSRPAVLVALGLLLAVGGVWYGLGRTGSDGQILVPADPPDGFDGRDGTTAETTPTTSTDSVPGSVSPIPVVGLDPTEGFWNDPGYLGAFESGGVVATVPESRKIVLFERTSAVVEGCEGGTDPINRLVLYDIDSDLRTVLVEELSSTDQSIEIGPQGRVAVIGGCDANAWLAAVGVIDPGGSLTLRRLDEPERSVRLGNNAGVSVTWSTSGEVLFVNTVQVDAETGQPLRSTDPNSPLQIHAELADGSRLVSTTEASGEETPFWLIEPDDPLDAVPVEAPLFVGQATYPVAQIEIAANGQQALAGIDRWTQTEHTVIMSADEVVRVAGAAWFSPDGSRVLTRVGPNEATIWSVVNLETGAGTLVPIPDEAGPSRHVQWIGDGQALLITATKPDRDLLDIWFVEPKDQDS